MKIKELTLFSNQCSAQKEFFTKQLNFELLEEEATAFAIRVGFTKLRFQQASVVGKYHYCFLIPSNQLEDAIEWLQKRISIVQIEGTRIKQRFENWNAESIYFWDGDGNLAEFIVRYDLKNSATKPFDQHSIISVNEIGMPTNKISEINQFLKTKLNSSFWKGDLERFGTNGTQEGLFLLVNQEIKKTWFPTNLKPVPVPFKAKIEVDGNLFELDFDGKDVFLLN